jgi:hypothetical protein
MGRHTFEEWKTLVDRELYRKCGMNHRDLQDVLYHEAHRNGVNAKDLASAIMTWAWPLRAVKK